jgi:hypothetical protein
MKSLETLKRAGIHTGGEFLNQSIGAVSADIDYIRRRMEMMIPMLPKSAVSIVAGFQDILDVIHE